MGGTIQLILIGGPGAGKGIQAEAICKAHPIPHISTGDILRREVAEGSELGVRVREIMDQGLLVDDATMLKVVEHRLQCPDTESGFILDGFPRTLDQARGLSEILKRRPVSKVCVLVLSVSDDEMTRRMMGRGRADDTPETVARRIAKFHRETEDAIAYYQEKGQLVRIDGEQGIELVTRDVLNAIEDYLGWF